MLSNEKAQKKQDKMMRYNCWQLNIPLEKRYKTIQTE